jgi:hypothetical protein
MPKKVAPLSPALPPPLPQVNTAGPGVRLGMQVASFFEQNRAKESEFISAVNKARASHSAAAFFEDIEEITEALCNGSLDVDKIKPIFAEFDRDFAEAGLGGAREAFTQEVEAETSEDVKVSENVEVAYRTLLEDLDFYGEDTLFKLYAVLFPKKDRSKLDLEGALSKLKEELKHRYDNKKLKKKLLPILRKMREEITRKDEEVLAVNKFIYTLKDPKAYTEETLEAVEQSLGRTLDLFSLLLRALEQKLFGKLDNEGIKIDFTFSYDFVSMYRIDRIIALIEKFAQAKGDHHVEDFFKNLKFQEKSQDGSKKSITFQEKVEKLLKSLEIALKFVPDELEVPGKLNAENVGGSFRGLQSVLNEVLSNRIDKKVRSKLFLSTGQVDGPQFVRAKNVYDAHCALQKLHLRTLQLLTELEEEKRLNTWKNLVSKALLQFLNQWEIKAKADLVALLESDDYPRALAKFKEFVQTNQVTPMHLQKAADFIENLITNREEESQLRAQEVDRFMQLGRCIHMSPAEVASALFDMKLKPDLNFVSSGKILEIIATAGERSQEAIEFAARRLSEMCMMLPHPYHTECEVPKGALPQHIRTALAQVGFHHPVEVAEPVILEPSDRVNMQDQFQFNPADVSFWDVAIEQGQAFLVAKTLRGETLVDANSKPVKLPLTKKLGEEDTKARRHRLESYVISQGTPFDPLEICSLWMSAVILDNSYVTLQDSEGRVIYISKSSDEPIQLRRVSLHRDALSKAQTLFIHLPDEDQNEGTLLDLSKADLSQVEQVVFANLLYPDLHDKSVRKVDPCSKNPVEMYRVGNLLSKLSPNLRSWVVPSLTCKVTEAAWLSKLRHLDNLECASLTLLCDSVLPEQLEVITNVASKLKWLKVKLTLSQLLSHPGQESKAQECIFPVLESLIKAKLPKLALDIPMLSSPLWQLIISQLQYGDLEVVCDHSIYAAEESDPMLAKPVEAALPSKMAYNELRIHPVPVGFSKMAAPFFLPAVINLAVEAEPLSRGLLSSLIAQGVTRALILRECNLTFSRDVMRLILDFCSFRGQTSGLIRELANASGKFSAQELETSQDKIKLGQQPLAKLWEELTSRLKSLNLNFDLDFRTADTDLISLALAALSLMVEKKNKKKETQNLPSLFIEKLKGLLERRQSSLRHLDVGGNLLGAAPIMVLDEVSLDDEDHGYLALSAEDETISMKSFAPSEASSMGGDRLKETAVRREAMAKSPEGYLIGMCTESWPQIVHLGVDGIGGDPDFVIDAIGILLTTSLAGAETKPDEVRYSLKSLKIGSNDWTLDQVERLLAALNYTLIDSIEVPHTNPEVLERVRAWNINRKAAMQKEDKAMRTGDVKGLLARLGRTPAAKA